MIAILKFLLFKPRGTTVGKPGRLHALGLRDAEDLAWEQGFTVAHSHEKWALRSIEANHWDERNPYPLKSKLRNAWTEGFDHALEEMTNADHQAPTQRLAGTHSGV